MTRFRTVLGMVGGAFIILSSAAHSFLGWKQLHADLTAAQAPADLIKGLGIGWHFGGAAMLTFGCICVAIFTKRFRGQTVSTLPVAIITMLYLGFGIGAMVVTGGDPFFIILLVPGVLLAIACPAGNAR